MWEYELFQPRGIYMPWFLSPSMAYEDRLHYAIGCQEKGEKEEECTPSMCGARSRAPWWCNNGPRSLVKQKELREGMEEERRDKWERLNN